MDRPAETQTEQRYRMVCDMVNDRLSAVVRSIRDAGRVQGGLEDRQGDILCDLTQIQGILYKVCAAGVKQDRKEYLDLVIGDFKESKA